MAGARRRIFHHDLYFRVNDPVPWMVDRTKQPMSKRIEEPAQAGQTIYELIVEANNDDRRDLRSEVRIPLFRPISIRMDGHDYSAFTRDVSDSGIGLVHNFKVKLDEVEISIPSKHGWFVRVRTQIVWCRNCDEEWYVSGGRFIGLTRAGA
jgi:hypothetical protein